MVTEGHVESTSRRVFDLTMQVAFEAHPTATHVLVNRDAGCMVFFWHEPKKLWPAQKLFKAMDWRKASDYAWEWLRSVLKKAIPAAADAAAADDEMFSGAFRIKFGGEFRLYWKKEHQFATTDGSPYGICSVHPTWQEVHKCARSRSMLATGSRC